MVLVAIAGALLVCEGIARVMFPRPPDATRQPQLGFSRDPEIRYVPLPSQRGWIDDGLVSVNSRGFRGAEVTIPKPPGRFRIVVIGDSLTLGWGVNDEETYAARLEQRLRREQPTLDVDVVNLGVGGYNTRQSVTWLSRHVDELRPDLVLLGFYSNDVPDAIEDGKGGTRVAAARGDSSNILRINPTPTGWLDRQLRRSRLIYVAGRAINRMRGAGEWGLARFAMEIDMLDGRESPDLQRAWQTIDQEFRRLDGLADEFGFKVGIVILPCQEQVMGQYPAAAYQHKVTSLGRLFGFDVIDPLPLMAERRETPGGLFIPYDRNHPSATGHAVVAEAIEQHLSAERLASSPE
jgi:lysophospholipase L1-like esterase